MMKILGNWEATCIGKTNLHHNERWEAIFYTQFSETLRAFLGELRMH